MNTKGQSYPKSVILQAVYFKLRFTFSYRDVEDIMKIRGVQVDHSTNTTLGVQVCSLY